MTNTSGSSVCELDDDDDQDVTNWKQEREKIDKSFFSSSVCVCMFDYTIKRKRFTHINTHDDLFTVLFIHF